MSSTNFVTIKRFEALTGYTEIATNSKIDNGIWRLGKEWQRAPDGRRIMDIAGYERWVLGEEPRTGIRSSKNSRRKSAS